MPRKKFFSVFLFLIVALTATPFPLRSETSVAGTETSLALSNLAVPEEIGKVQERFTGKSSRTIIQIQDVHAHASAQANIAAILERLRVVFGIEQTALEGAWSSTSLPKSHAIPTSREKQLLAGTLLDDDLISGPVYAAIMSPEPITLIGIEDEPSYEKNRSLFLAHLGKIKGVNEKLRTYGTSLKKSQRSIWGPELLAFGNVFGKFRETSDLGKFLPLLLKTADDLGVASSDLTQILLLRDIMALEKSFEKERLENEAKQVIKKYKNKPWTIEELLRGGKIPPEEIGLYPEIKKLTRLYRMRDEISLRNLTAQIEILTGRILEKLVRTPEEKALWEKSERFYLARRILLLQASPSDIKAFESERPALESELTAAGLSDALLLSLDFYEVVKKRDEIFFNRIVNDPALAGNIAIVTGGFHTDGLSERFRDAGISYITIAPELGDTVMNEKLYNKRMAADEKQDGGKWMMDGEKQKTKDFSSSNIQHPTSSTLSELRNAIATVDENFPPAFEILKQTKDIRRAETRFTGDTVTVSASNKIAHLSREGHLRKSAGPSLVNVSNFRESEFMALPRSEQRALVRRLMEQANHSEQKAMLVSSVSVLQKLLAANARSEVRIEEIVKRGDILALLQDVPSSEVPEPLLAPRGIERFEVENMGALVDRTPRFQRLAKRFPFVIMKNGYRSENRVVVDEDPIWLELFPVLILNARLYESAQNTAFLDLLKILWSEVLSRELPSKSV